MAKSMKDLRQEKGYRSAREFADALGIATSSMSRYDRDPESIPMKHAWAMADLLDCSIDEIVGREHTGAAASELQAFYDGLLPETRTLFDEFIEFARLKDEGTRRKSAAEEERNYEDLCRFYERLFYQSLNESGEFGKIFTFAGTPEARAAFEQFVSGEAAEKREAQAEAHCSGIEADLRGDGEFHTEEEIRETLDEEREAMSEKLARQDEEVIAAIMQAYDRLHRSAIEYAVVRF